MGLPCPVTSTNLMTALCIQPCSADSIIMFNDVDHSTPFQCQITVQPHQSSTEVDHINNIEYLRWIDKGAQLHCDACGWTRQQLLDAGMMWFVAKHEIEYLAEASLKDTLRLTTWVDDIRRVKSWRSSLIHSIGDPHITVCRCRTLWVLVDLATRRPMSVPKEMGIALNPKTTPRVVST